MADTNEIHNKHGVSIGHATSWDSVLQRAAARWHSDSVMVCLQRALQEIEQLELELQASKSAPPTDPLERIATTLEIIAERIAPPPPAPPAPDGP